MEAKEQAYGVLLYYKYAQIPDVKSIVDFYDSNCRSLGLVGRVRIAPDGVNVTVGGKMESLEKHVEEMKLNPLFDGTDFKLASCDQPTDDKIIRECGFDSLSIRVVKELVTFRSNPLASSPDVSNAGQHLSATEFHSVLHDVMNGGGNEKEMVLLDARNVYETRIGKFEVPNVETLDPQTRQYSDLPSWIDNHSDQLRGKSVLMYCTGGIRCEMASAYIRTKGADFKNVFQLYGGIQRYLEEYPDGGFFKGKNFVFDHRISVGSSDDKVVGSCLLCGSSFDDYSSRNRCSFCRMLVLVCSECEGRGAQEYRCDLCQKIEKGSSTEELPVEVMSDSLEAQSIDQIKPFTDEFSLTNDMEQSQEKELASPSEERKELQKGVVSPEFAPKSAKMQFVSSHPEVYEPCDDSFLLVDALLADRSNLINQNPKFCLEIGCGSGYVITSLALILSEYCPSTQFFATDINLHATQTTLQTSANHGVHCEVVLTDIALCLQKRLWKNIDVLVVNPPYVPTPEDEVGAVGIVSSWAGGFKGRMVIDRILDVVDELLSSNGLTYMVLLSENDPLEICQVMREKGFGSRIALQRLTEEEKLCVIKFWREK